MALRKFIIERDIPAVGSLERDELRGAAAKSNEVLRQLGPDIQWLESFVAADKTFCVYLAKDEISHQEARRDQRLSRDQNHRSPQDDRSHDRASGLISALASGCRHGPGSSGPPDFLPCARGGPPPFTRYPLLTLRGFGSSLSRCQLDPTARGTWATGSRGVDREQAAAARANGGGASSIGACRAAGRGQADWGRRNRSERIRISITGLSRRLPMALQCCSIPAPLRQGASCPVQEERCRATHSQRAAAFSAPP